MSCVTKSPIRCLIPLLLALPLVACDEAPDSVPSVESPFDGAAGGAPYQGTGGAPAPGPSEAGSGGTMASGDGDTGPQDFGVDDGAGDPTGGTGGVTGDGDGDDEDLGEDPGTGDQPPPANSGGPVTGDNGIVCGGDTPHGCYSLAPDQLPDCPEQSPELPWKYAGCNGLAPAQACTYQNAGKMFDCICDTGVHWICFYVD